MIPVTNWNRTPPTSASSDSRSSSDAIEITGGQAKSFGTTDHSFASTTGVSTMPPTTCRPWLRR